MAKQRGKLVYSLYCYTEIFMKFLAELYHNARAVIAKSVDVITQLFSSQRH